MSFKKLLVFVCCLILCIAITACSYTPSIPSTPNDNTSDVVDNDNNGDINDSNKENNDSNNSGNNNDGDISNGNDSETSDGNGTDGKKDDDEGESSVGHNFVLVESEAGIYTYKCDCCNEEYSIEIACDEGTENAYTVENNSITFNSIDAKSAYTISGKFYGNIVVDVGDDYKFELQMCGFELYSFDECPLSILSGDKVTLSAKKSTENHIYDMREKVDDEDDSAIKASIYARCDLSIQGKGTLAVKSTNNNGIHTKDDLTIKNLSLKVDCKDNALKGNDSVTIESGELVLIARQGDGIKTKNSDVSSKGKQRGTIQISGGDITIYAACDGIDAAYDVCIDESESAVTLQIFTDKYSEYSEEVTATSDDMYYVRFNSSSYKYSFKFYNDETDYVWSNSSSYTRIGNGYYYSMTKPSGYAYVQLFIYSSSQQQGQEDDCLGYTDGMTVNNNYDTIALQSRGGSLSYGWTNYTTSQMGGMGMGGMGGMGGMNEGNTDKGDHSTKGIKSDNNISISAGTITINAYDDAIHTNNDNELENGETPLGNVSISGGTLTLSSNDDGIHADGKVIISGGNISVLRSYEGIEGNTVEFSGGNISVIASDDGVNGTATSGTAISISGGTIYIYAGGDGVDSNSQTSYSGIVFAGGTCVIISTGQSDSSIDTERGYKYTGGYVIGIGKSGGMSSESTNCSGFSSVGTSKTISLQKDSYLVISDIAVIKMPTSINALVVCLGKSGASISSSSSGNYTLDSNGVCWIE